MGGRASKTESRFAQQTTRRPPMEELRSQELPGQRRQKIQMGRTYELHSERRCLNTKASIRKSVTKAHMRRTAPSGLPVDLWHNMNPTNYQTEFDAFMVQAIQVQADSDNAGRRSMVLFGSYKQPGKNPWIPIVVTFWDAGWKEADRATMRAKNINDLLERRQRSEWVQSDASG